MTEDDRELGRGGAAVWTIPATTGCADPAILVAKRSGYLIHGIVRSELISVVPVRKQHIWCYLGMPKYGEAETFQLERAYLVLEPGPSARIHDVGIDQKPDTNQIQGIFMS